MVTSKIRLERELGAGGMGSVWIARNLALEVDVAVKFIAAHVIAGDPTALARFKREATLAAQIKSHHVVQVFDHGVTDGTAFMVMELLDGESLQDRMHSQGPLSLEECSHILNQTCSALNEAHQLGVVHRDIKPDNIYLTPHDGSIFVKVLDFGIAKAPDSARSARLTATSAVAGTPHYMSPEQFLSTRNVTTRADLWSLAVVVYEALTGFTPWNGDTVTALGMAVCQNDFPAITALRPELPAGLDAFFHKALSKRPEDRHATAKELAREFQHATATAIHSSAAGAMHPQAPLPTAGAAAIVDPHTPSLQMPAATIGIETVTPAANQDAVLSGRPTGQSMPPVTQPAAQLVAPASSTKPSWVAVLAALVGTAIVSVAAVWALLRQDADESAPTTATAVTTDTSTPVPVTSASASAVSTVTAAETDTTPPADSATPTASASTAVAQPAHTATAVRPIVTGKGTPPPPPPPPPQPAANCEGNAAYTRDGKGHLVIRPECQ